MKVFLIYSYFYCYMIKNVFFGYSIITFHLLEEEELKKIYKQLILDKLKLGMKFLQRVLYIHNKVLEVGIMKLSIILVFLTLDYIFGTLNWSVKQIILLNQILGNYKLKLAATLNLKIPLNLRSNITEHSLTFFFSYIEVEI